MKLQTERCSQCGTLRRPTNLQSKHSNVLDETGQFLITDFWFCSDKCFEVALEKFIHDPEYSLKYDVGELTYCPPGPGEKSDTLSLPPRLAKKLKAMEELYLWWDDCRQEFMWPQDYLFLFRKRFGRDPQPGEIPESKQDLINRMNEAVEDWRRQQENAISDAKVEMNDELTAEDIHLFDIQCAKDYKDIEAGAQRKQREEEQKRKEAEREEEKRRREQERLEEKRQREEEKRRKEEEERAAREAETQRWRPRPFKLR